MVEIIKNIGTVSAAVVELIACIAIFVKPIRKRFVAWLRKVTDADSTIEIKQMLSKQESASAERDEKLKQMFDKQEVANTERDNKINHLVQAEVCHLRDRITDMYAKYMKVGSIPQKRREELINDYEMYKKMGGNTYIDIIYPELLELPVDSNWI